MSVQEPEDDQTLPDELDSQQPGDDELAFPDLKLGDAWGESITKQRAGVLETLLQDAEHGFFELKGLFAEMELTGADVFWLSERASGEANDMQATVANDEPTYASDVESDSDGFVRKARANALHLEGARLQGALLDGAILQAAHLEGAHLIGASLEGAVLMDAHLEGAYLNYAQLADAVLMGTHLEGTHLNNANLERALLDSAHLEGAILIDAHLEGAQLTGACLEGRCIGMGDLARIRKWTPAFPKVLPPANIRLAYFDSSTILNSITFSNNEFGGVSLADVRWGNVNIAVVDWTRTVPGFLGIHKRIEAIELGDERKARNSTRLDEDWRETPKDKQAWLQGYIDAVRANQQLVTTLRQQGLNDDADRFAYRAQSLRREVLKRQGNFAGYAFSLLLWALSGYGYRLWRIVAAYGLVLTIFAVVFLVLGVHSHSGEPGIQALWDSFLVSLSAIHGRTVFEQLGAWTPAAWVAAVESVVGIVIEGIFIAMLIQRFFAR